MFLFLLVLLKVCECGQNQSIENEKKKTITEKKEEFKFHELRAWFNFSMQMNKFGLVKVQHVWKLLIFVSFDLIISDVYIDGGLGA